jgi:FkbM family methyltransferase
MSDLSTDFLVSNFYGKEINFFNIGCSDLGDTIDFKSYLPNAKFYAFECNENFREGNKVRAAEHGINYFHYALSDVEDKIIYYPSETLNGQKDWYISSSTLKPIPTKYFNLTYGEPYFVQSIVLDKFCDENNVSPDFVHIDVEGAEYKVLGKLGKYRPLCIWSEICAFDVFYESGNSYEDFDNLLYGYGYTKLYSSNNDALYIHDSFKPKDNKYI